MALSIPPMLSLSLSVSDFPATVHLPHLLSQLRQVCSDPQIHCIPLRNQMFRNAVITGFLSSTPARFTFILLIALPPCSGIQVRLYILSCYGHENENPYLWICTHRQDTRLRHRPYALPWRSSTEFLFQGHMP